VENDKAKCGYFPAKLSYAGGNTYNLKRHLVAKHPLVSLCGGDLLGNQRQGNILITNVPNIKYQLFNTYNLLFTKLNVYNY